MQVFEDMAELSSSSSYGLKTMSFLAELIGEKKKLQTITKMFLSPPSFRTYKTFGLHSRNMCITLFRLTRKITNHRVHVIWKKIHCKQVHKILQRDQSEVVQGRMNSKLRPKSIVIHTTKCKAWLKQHLDSRSHPRQVKKNSIEQQKMY